MKKTIMVALALFVAGAILSTAEAAKKDKKQKPSTPTVQLVTGSDSLSYTAGYVLADIIRERFLGGLAEELKDTPDSFKCCFRSIS